VQPRQAVSGAVLVALVVPVHVIIQLSAVQVLLFVLLLLLLLFLKQLLALLCQVRRLLSLQGCLQRGLILLILRQSARPPPPPPRRQLLVGFLRALLPPQALSSASCAR
jgi:hypothetical protein